MFLMSLDRINCHEGVIELDPYIRCIPVHLFIDTIMALETYRCMMPASVLSVLHTNWHGSCYI